MSHHGLFDTSAEFGEESASQEDLLKTDIAIKDLYITLGRAASTQNKHGLLSMGKLKATLVKAVEGEDERSLWVFNGTGSFTLAIKCWENNTSVQLQGSDEVDVFWSITRHPLDGTYFGTVEVIEDRFADKFLLDDDRLGRLNEVIAVTEFYADRIANFDRDRAAQLN